MCTVTLHRGANTLLLTMNRDEKRTRAPEVGPRLHRCEPTGVSWIAPLDGERSGTWAGMNSRGVAACLLNGYDPSDERRRAAGEMMLSRGNLIPELLAMRSLGEALLWLQEKFAPTPYASFRLLLADRQRVASVIWTGQGSPEFSAPLGEWQMFTSSSWNAAEVLPWRERHFGEWLRDGAPFAGDLPAFHLSQPEAMAEWSPLMRRDITATRSITQLAIGPGNSAVLRYWQSPGIYTSIPDATLELAVEG